MGKNHTVKDGECATSIAADNGFATVKDLFGHPDNAALRKLRPNPNLLAAGDVIVIPDHKPKTKPKTLALKVDAKHKLVVTRPKAELHARRANARDVYLNRIYRCCRYCLADRPRHRRGTL